MNMCHFDALKNILIQILFKFNVTNGENLQTLQAHKIERIF